MLVLTRKKNQSIVVNDNIELTIIDIQGDQVRVGINAPRDVKVFRKEVYVEMTEENPGEDLWEDTPTETKDSTIWTKLAALFRWLTAVFKALLHVM